MRLNKLHNAALSGEQRLPPDLNYCAVNTEAEANRKCQALGIRLKRFVMLLFYENLEASFLYTASLSRFPIANTYTTISLSITS